LQHIYLKLLVKLIVNYLVVNKKRNQCQYICLSLGLVVFLQDFKILNKLQVTFRFALSVVCSYSGIVYFSMSVVLTRAKGTVFIGSTK